MKTVTRGESIKVEGGQEEKKKRGGVGATVTHVPLDKKIERRGEGRNP